MIKQSSQKAEIVRLDKVQDPTIYRLQDTHFRFKDMSRLKVKVWENVYLVDSNHKKAEVATLISDKTDFKTNKQKILEINRDTL